jgi:hypothetical protein
MKTKEQELALLGLQEMNDSEKDEMAGGYIGIGGIIEIFQPICCIDIPPRGGEISGDWIVYDF